MASQELNLPADCTLVIPVLTIEGGSSTESELVSSDKNGEESIVVKKTTKIVDDVSERAHAEKLRSQATNAIKKHSQYTVIGFLASKANADLLTEELALISQRCADFNADAKTCKVTVSTLNLPISVCLGPEAVRAIADNVRIELETIRDQIRAGKVKGGAMGRIKNLTQLATGAQRDAIAFAIENANDAICKLRAGSKDQGGISETPESVGRGLDLSMIDNAIDCFRY